MIRLLLFSLSILLLANPSFSQQIKLNQLGFYPDADKIAVVPTADAGECRLLNEAGEELATFPLNVARTWFYSDETVRVCDFTSFTTPGRYKLVMDGVGESHLFEINPYVHLGVLKGALRGYYYQRSSTAITEPYGGLFTREAGHPDTVVYIHASAATDLLPEGTQIASPKGWYDAGDYNKYIVNSGISTFSLLSLFEHYPNYFDSLSLMIPESSNNLPDLLDEALWNVEWMLTMQDPNDGGVYHKCTTPWFSGTVQPVEDVSNRYVVMKTTAATLNFAAVMAVTARIFRDFEAEKPGFSDQCQAAAVAAWNWAKANPAVYYSQPSDIRTGLYDDLNVLDEFDWASAELFITTGDATYLTSEDVLSSGINIPDWKSVNGLPWVSLALHIESLTSEDSATVASKVSSLGFGLLSTFNSSGYKTAMGNNSGDFRWGSNAMAGNQGMMLLQAYRITSDIRFLQAALGNLDYLLGKNPIGYCFVTGYGSKSPMNIHHRMSASDDIPGPIPGLVPGGPNPGQEDNCSYPSNLPALSYSDTYCSHASNEVAINYSGAFVYLAGAIEAEMGGNSKAPAILIQPSSQAAQEAMSVSFDVVASGENLLYQWQKNGVNIPEADSTALILPSVSATDEGIYRVLVISGNDTVSSRNVTFTLLVKGPFGGVRHVIPGKVEVEDYDEGGQSLGYYDSSPGNSGGGYREDDADVEATGDTGGGYNIGWTSPGEWLEYSVNVTHAGNYLIEFRLASPQAIGSTGSLTFLVDGVSVAGTVVPPSTGGWQTYQSVIIEDISLTEGDHIFRINIGESGFNFNYFRVVDMDNCAASSDNTFNTLCGSCQPATICTAIDDAEIQAVQVYPNPSSGTFTLSLEKIKPGAVLVLTSMDGKQVVNMNLTGSTFTFGENLEKGLYVGRIVQDDKVQVFEVIKY